MVLILQSVKKYIGTTKETFRTSKAKALNPLLLPKSLLQKQGKRKNQKLHMFWQSTTLIKGERGFVPLYFLTDCSFEQIEYANALQLILKMNTGK